MPEFGGVNALSGRRGIDFGPPFRRAPTPGETGEFPAIAVVDIVTRLVWSWSGWLAGGRRYRRGSADVQV